ncbi:MAG: NOB1 family endonuclease [Candidatus Asgardarchaeia archaeon]
MKVYVLDSSSLMYGMNLPILCKDAEIWITDSILEEVKDKHQRELVETLILSGRVRIKEVPKRYTKIVEEISLRIGERESLSDTDKEVIALAMYAKDEGLRPVVYTDDYSIQNVLGYLGMEYSCFGTEGIRETWIWKFYCPACKRTFKSPTEDGLCPVCGTKLKRYRKKL